MNRGQRVPRNSARRVVISHAETLSDSLMGALSHPESHRRGNPGNGLVLDPAQHDVPVEDPTLSD